MSRLQEIGDLLRVNFYRPSYKKSAISYEDKIIEYLKTHENVKSQEIADYIGLKISRTKDYLSKLVEEGKVTAIGGNKNRTYVLKIDN